MRKAIIVPLLLLAACGGKEEGGNNSADSDVPPASAPEQVDQNLTVDPQNSAVPVALPSPAGLKSLPSGYAGRWGMTPDDCKNTAGSRGLMTIAGDTLTLADGRGTVSGIVATSPGRVTATIDLTGNGSTSRQPTALTLIDGGRTLLREQQNPPASFRYSRCPAT